MALKFLTFTTLLNSSRNPAEARRAKTIARLEEQKRLLADPSHVRTTKRWVKINGEKSLIEKQQRAYPWWRTGPNGSVVFFIRLGGKPIEFEKGKAGIAVPTPGKLPEVIDAVIAAVRAGELDDALAQSSKSRPMPKRKAA
jgi:hypothetical protein